jgi:hypothetical protein
MLDRLKCGWILRWRAHPMAPDPGRPEQGDDASWRGAFHSARGQVMAINRYLRHYLGRWRDEVVLWIRLLAPKVLLNADIFDDFQRAAVPTPWRPPCAARPLSGTP